MKRHYLRLCVRGIALDAVGTFMEPRPAVAQVYADVARGQGVTFEPVAVKSRFDRHFRQSLNYVRHGPMTTDEQTEFDRWRQIAMKVLPGLPHPDRAFQELWDHFARPSSWAVFGEAAAALRALEMAGFRLRLASNFDTRLRSVVRDMPAFAHLAETAVIASEVGYRKPHLAFYRSACESMDLLPEQVLFAGDDPENDVRGPRRAGLNAILVDRSRINRRRVLSVPDLTALADLFTGPRQGMSMNGRAQIDH
jgi:putative hydrolase of the HAD superfamily